jgi:hypothetical protein
MATAQQSGTSPPLSVAPTATQAHGSSQIAATPTPNPANQMNQSNATTQATSLPSSSQVPMTTSQQSGTPAPQSPTQTSSRPQNAFATPTPGNAASHSAATAQVGTSGPPPDEKPGPAAAPINESRPSLLKRLADSTSWTKAKYLEYEMAKDRKKEYVDFIAPEQSRCRSSLLSVCH